ncbi:MAG: oligosaccharide flippase family protein, partial [Bacteroidales bacterium]
MLENLSEKNIRILTGIFGGALGRSISLLAPFIIMPIILNMLGTYLFGIWMTVLSFTAMALFMDFGIGNGLLTRLSHANGLKNYAEMRGYIISAYCCLSLISLILIIVVISIYGLAELGLFSFKVQNNEAINIVLVSILIFIIGIPISIVQRIMYAKQEILKFNLWQILGAIASLLFCFVAISLNLSGWIVILSYSLPPLLVLIVLTFIIFNKNKEIRPSFNDYSRGKSLELLKIGSKFLILSILTSISLNIDNLIISFNFGAESVTDFAVSAKISSLLSIVVTTLFLPLWAANGDAFAKKDYDWVLKTAKIMSLLGVLVIVFLSFFLVYFNYEIMHLWMNHQFKDQKEILISFCLLSFFMAIGSPWFMVLN